MFLSVKKTHFIDYFDYSSIFFLKIFKFYTIISVSVKIATI
jgi:hypothetical protein